jgi:maltoporin
MRTIIVALALLAGPAFGAELDYGLYLRTSAGTNSEGGKQILLNNPGSQANEFRLGNESTYSEVTFTGHAFKTADKTSPFFDAVLTFVYNPAMNSQYGDTTSNTDYTQVVQAYLKAGNLPEVPYTLWAGKRFYRDVSAYMNDFFWFADMSGVGAGVEAIPLGNGHLAVAYLQRADNNFQNASNGLPAKQALDVRWRDLKLGEKSTLHLWMAGAYSAPGQGTYNSAPITYQAASGSAYGVRWRRNLGENAGTYNDLGLEFGHGNMATLGLENANSFAQTGVYDPGANRIRLVENIVFELTDRWGVEGVFVHELADSGKQADARSMWTSVGARPHYKWSEHIRLTLEAGFSSVEVKNERDGNGERPGARTLTRVTFAPEVIVGRAFHARPILRAYVTHTSWNGANGDTTNSGSMLGKLASSNNTAFNGESGATQFGFQGEIWF